ncbi:hypothetical protein D8674_021250 [Pyrus ussuriensis x Pyrus communis]|uniref:Uncharacterized protein n=1 Tax=Pyrus ussuriensis x Pyrus communis TaxID=2448454 RepID=A0A5N5GM32_9ROSA|nr:hypothetical protein D8674_021250 [Pyrus ussuriensis x Pyrus communis]
MIAFPATSAFFSSSSSRSFHLQLTLTISLGIIQRGAAVLDPANSIPGSVVACVVSFFLGARPILSLQLSPSGVSSGNDASMVGASFLITAMLGCSSTKVSLEQNVARAFTYLLIVSRIYSNTTCLKLVISFSAIMGDGAMVLSFTAKLPWTWLRTKFESPLTRIFLASISLAVERPVMKASYSTTLFEHEKLSLKAMAVAWLSRLTSTMPAFHFVVVEEPSKCMTHSSSPTVAATISGTKDFLRNGGLFFFEE